MTRYFGVVGIRDYIKLRGIRTPFWEFLDVQPDGWLTSLTYKFNGLPKGKPIIYDCGAWSYKDKDVPPINSAVVAELYAEYAPTGTMCIAPDHMLVAGCDVDSRSKWNLAQARKFMRDCPTGMIPMATIHGMDDEERVCNALKLLDIGYRHLAMGGLAARASQPKVVMAAVERLRAETKGAWLHVLGLSSPKYMAKWAEIGVESADGSSHFKQAFTGGAFYWQDGVSLIKHIASRPGEPLPADMPTCDCLACSKLRKDGVDTRTYGSNENNMGRAAHNLNMLMRAQKAAMTPAVVLVAAQQATTPTLVPVAAQKATTIPTVVLVACCGPKLAGTHPAQDIYQSDLFKKSKAYAEQHGDKWAILSALHGLVMPDQLLEKYDITLNTMTTKEKRKWSELVGQQISERFPGARLIVLAGTHYCGWINGSFFAERPMEGLGIGRQLRWLIDNTRPSQARRCVDKQSFAGQEFELSLIVDRP